MAIQGRAFGRIGCVAPVKVPLPGLLGVTVSLGHRPLIWVSRSERVRVSVMTPEFTLVMRAPTVDTVAVVTDHVEPNTNNINRVMGIDRRKNRDFKTTSFDCKDLNQLIARLLCR